MSSDDLRKSEVKLPESKVKPSELVNLTPHKVTVFKGGKMVEFVPSGKVARVKVKQEVIGEVNGIPIVRTELEKIEGLKSVCANCRRKCSYRKMSLAKLAGYCPDQEPITIFIVSSMVTMMAPKRKDLVSPDTGPTAVRDSDGNVVAVRRFQIFSLG